MTTLAWPIPGAPLGDGYGHRDPIATGGGTSGGFHYGQDFPAAGGTPIRAAAAGVIQRAGWIGTFGNAVYIDHGDGLVTRYAHMVATPPVGVGWHVEAGDVIGYVGTTGASTGNHLHFEAVLHGNRIDPLPLLTNNPTTVEEEEEEEMKNVAMYRMVGKTYHVIIGTPGSGFKLKYETGSSTYNNTKAKQFDTGSFTEEDESVMRNFEAALDAVAGR